MDAARDAASSEAPVVAIQAPAGCGKTHEAIETALTLASPRHSPQELLFLAHTNAAVGEFKRRVRGSRIRYRAMTADSFALELVAAYARPLRLPTPIIPGDGTNQVPFSLLAPRAVELLNRAPSVARALATHYPCIIVDEYQDMSVDQAELAFAIADAGNVRLRAFADPMQAIYDIDTLASWEDLLRRSDRVEELDHPHRWTEAPQLGRWIMDSRELLREGRPIALRRTPDSVKVLTVKDQIDAPHFMSGRIEPALIKPLNDYVRRLEGSVAVLTRYNPHVRALNSSLRGAVRLNEGANYQPAYDGIETASAAIGNSRAMALALVGFLSETCTGLSKRVKDQVMSSLKETGIDVGKKKTVRPLLAALTPLYGSPDLATWCQVVNSVVTDCPAWLKPDFISNLRVIANLRPSIDDSGRELLDVATRRIREAAILPRRVVSTIHKAKGNEYDHVVLVHCSASIFPDDVSSRRLLYTGVSRARRSLTLVLPGESHSPLLARTD